MSMKIGIILLAIILVFSGCLSPPDPRFQLDGTGEKLDFNPLSFEALKLWNRANFTTKEVQLDACNNARRLDTYEWCVTLKGC